MDKSAFRDEPLHTPVGWTNLRSQTNCCTLDGLTCVHRRTVAPWMNKPAFTDELLHTPVGWTNLRSETNRCIHPQDGQTYVQRRTVSRAYTRVMDKPAFTDELLHKRAVPIVPLPVHAHHYVYAVLVVSVIGWLAGTPV